MAPKRTLLEKMKASPIGWTIGDVSAVCDENGCELLPPSNGSHYKAVSHHLAGHLTVPFKRPIKPHYIRSLVSMIEAHNMFEKQKGRR